MADVFNKNPSSFVDMNELFPVLNERTGLTSEQFKKVVENLIYVYNNLASGGGSGSSSGGVVFIPSVDANGNLSWTNNGGLTNPDTINIKGLPGKNGVNGKNVVYIVPNETWTDNDVSLTNCIDSDMYITNVTIDDAWLVGDNAIIPYFNSTCSANRILGGEITYLDAESESVGIILKWFTN